MDVGLFSKKPEPAPEPEPSDFEDDVKPQRRGAALYVELIEWPKKAVFPRDLLADRPEGLRWRGDIVDISCSNGRAIYQLADCVDGRFLGTLVYSEGPEIA